MKIKPQQHLFVIAMFVIALVVPNMSHAQGKTKAPLAVSPKVECFPLQDVRLLPSRFMDNFKRDSAWMMSIPVDRLLHSFRNTAGVYTSREGGYMTMKKLGGWESLDCDLRGHITGHLLSALATLHAQTNSASVKAKADSIINGLNEVQHTYGTGYLSAFGEGLINRNMQGKGVWAPWYTLHKIAQGLLDQYLICGNDTALSIVDRMAEWAYRKLEKCNDEQRRKMIRNEFGGFNEAMYNLYAINNNPHALWLARFFYHNEKIDPLKEGNADLGTNHANTFIPKLLGEWRNYELFGDAKSRKAAELLFFTLVRNHAFVTGEVSDKEHLFDPKQQSKHLSGYDGENCCTYNLLKLAQKIQAYNEDTESIDYIERALYNHILGQQDPESGMLTYFTPLLSGAYRLYSTRDSSFWCCVGSGFESHVKYASFIYSHSDHALNVNLFIPSQVNWDGTTITQTTDFPASGTTQLTISGQPRKFQLRFRYPWWASSWEVKINGKKVKPTIIKNGKNTGKESSAWASINRMWQPGDKISITFQMKLHEEATKDNSSKVALMYGPIVLAGELEPVSHPFSNPKAYNDYYTYDFKVPTYLSEKCCIHNLNDLKQNSTLTWKTRSSVIVRPFYDVHHQRYVVYWDKK
jgi:DUF1680 family protein